MPDICVAPSTSPRGPAPHAARMRQARQWTAGLLLLLALCLPALAMAVPSLEQIRSYPFPEELVASKGSDRVVWLVNDAGKRNVWTASAPDYQPRQVTPYTDDDGQELTSLLVSNDGSRIVYVRGGEHGGNWNGGAPANPTSMPGETTVDIWTVEIDGRQPSAPRKLANGDDPALSPDGRRVAYIKDNAAWIVDTSGRGEAKRLFWTRGSVGSLQWSPDGSRLAFVTSRESHSLIGIYRDDKTPLLWISPAAARDGQPRWSADGRQLLFVRSAGSGGPPREMLRFHPRPWAIWVANTDTGVASQRWASGRTLRDSYYWEQPEWAADGRIVFRSYSDGWQHLYSLSADGGAPLLLTPGDYMVENFTLSADGKRVIFDANTGSEADDIDRRHLFEVAVDRAQPRPLTRGQGLEWSPRPTPRGDLLFISSTGTRPPQPSRLGANGAIDLLPGTAAPGYPADALVTPRRVTYKSTDGLTVHGQLFEPKPGTFPGKRPAVVYVHGGPQRQMLLGWHYMGYYSNDYAVNQYLASRGYVVLSINYRLGPGYGHGYHFPEASGVRGASEYRDVKAGGQYLQSLANVDANRIGIYGGSYGGYLTAMALAHDSKLFKVGVDVHGVHDWVSDEYGNLFKRNRFEVPPDAERAMQVGWESSPASAVKTWTSPVLFIHGDDDRNVMVGQTVDLVQRLEGTGVHHETMILVDETHSIQRHDNVIRMNAAVVEFLQRYLEPKAQP